MHLDAAKLTLVTVGLGSILLKNSFRRFDLMELPLSDRTGRGLITAHELTG
jgi:hypothetical protein